MILIQINTWTHGFPHIKVSLQRDYDNWGQAYRDSNEYPSYYLRNTSRLVVPNIAADRSKYRHVQRGEDEQGESRSILPGKGGKPGDRIWLLYLLFRMTNENV